MIRILADSPDDARRIAAAAGGKARIAKNADQFSNGDGHQWQHGRTTLARFLEALVILRAKQLRSSGTSWKNVSADLGFARETLQRRSKRWTGHTLVQLERVPSDRLLTAFVEQYLPPEWPGDPRNG